MIAPGYTASVRCQCQRASVISFIYLELGVFLICLCLCIDTTVSCKLVLTEYLACEITTVFINVGSRKKVATRIKQGVDFCFYSR